MRPLEPVMTWPTPVDDAESPWATGNEWVSLPDVDPRTGAIGSVNVLWEGAPGLVEFRGADGPLLQPTLAIGGRPWSPRWTAEAVGGWLPRLTATDTGLGASLQIWAPPGRRGFVVGLTLTGEPDATPMRDPGTRQLELGFRLRAGAPRMHLFTARPGGGPWRLAHDAFTGALRQESLMPGLPAFAARPQAGGESSGAEVRFRPEPGVGAPPRDETGGAPGAPSPGADAGRAPRIRSWGEFGPHEGTSLHIFACLPAWSGRRASLVLFCGLNREGDGAALMTVDLARAGAGRLWEEAVRGLPAADPPPPVRRNLLFNLHFARGRALDTERPVAVTSRSPRYYVAAAHWTRDTLLWSLPGLLRSDPAAARETLLTTFERHTRHPGVHAQYTDGGLLYPGFELDQLAAFPLALERYVQATGDLALARDPRVTAVWRAWTDALEAAWDEERGLCRTELLPTDDPAAFPFHTYGNALLCAGLEAAARREWPLPGDPKERARRIRQAIADHLVRPGPFGPQYAGGAAADGGWAFFDEPPGSLELLAHYGFCPPDDPAFLATCRWIRSEHNPHAIASGGGAGDEAGENVETTCPHAPFRWTLGWANAMWAGAAAARHLDGARPSWAAEVFQRAEHAYRAFLSCEMDGGFACETVGEDGSVRTGAAFATCAGFLAAAALEWAETGPYSASPFNPRMT